MNHENTSNDTQQPSDAEPGGSPRLDVEELESFNAIPLFRDWVEGADIDTMPEQHEVNLLWQMYDEKVFQHIRKLFADPIVAEVYSNNAMRHTLAKGFIDALLGAGWTSDQIDREGKPATQKRSSAYLHPQARSDEMRGLKLHRINELARRLYQLQSFRWFDAMVKKFANDTLSGAAFEADVALALMVLPFEVTHRTEVGLKREDYDISYSLGGADVAVEVKTKDDATIYSKRTLEKTLSDASSQLPLDRPGVVFLRVPFSWASDMDIAGEYDRVVAHRMANSKTVSAVITAVDSIEVSRSGATRQALVTRIYRLAVDSNCPPKVAGGARLLADLLNNGLTQLAPREPF